MLSSTSECFDDVLIAWCPAHYVYPIRMRCLNVLTGKSGWVTVGYIPWVKPRHAANATDKTRLRIVRDSLLQRCLAVLLADLITASLDGANVTLAQHGSLLAVPRVVLYAADQPEERHVLGLQGNRCAYPCSACMTTTDKLASARCAAASRDTLGMLNLQMEATLLADRNEGSARVKVIAKTTSCLPFVPVLGAVQGLGSGDCMLYKVFGFDMLHVSLREKVSCGRGGTLFENWRPLMAAASRRDGLNCTGSFTASGAAFAARACTSGGGLTVRVLAIVSAPFLATACAPRARLYPGYR